MILSPPTDTGFREVGNTVLSANAASHYDRHKARGVSEATAIHLAKIIDRTDGLY